MNFNTINSFLRLSRPLFLLIGSGQYLLGVGIARYLGYPIDTETFWLGLLWVIVVQLAVHYLNAYFDRSPESLKSLTDLFGDGKNQLPRYTAILTAAGMLSIAAFQTTAWIQTDQIFPLLAILMSLLFLGGMLLVLPPVRLIESSYGELTAGVIAGNIIPLFGYVLHVGEGHRMVMAVSLPLTFLLIALFLILEFPRHASDVKHNLRNFLTLLGWENAMGLHNALLLMAFVALGAAGVIIIPRAVSLPAFIPFPLAILQIWLMRKIADGAKPNWGTMAFNGYIIYGLTAYIMLFIFWTR
jgi:1,4-dihydroxy-2-naphthoate octaprenyltransferase